MVHRSTAVQGRGGPPPPWESSCRTRTGPVEADGTVDAPNAPTAPWKTLRVSHELPQGLSHRITHAKPRKAPKWRWETRIDPAFENAGVADQHVSQTARCDTRARAPSGTRRRVSYPVSHSMSCIRRARRPVPRAERARRIARTDGLGDHFIPFHGTTKRQVAVGRRRRLMQLIDRQQLRVSRA